jgi:hypothetical protein
MFNNVTSLEAMTMRERRIPCFGYSSNPDYVPNEYDMMWLANLRQVLGNRMLFWLIPTDVEMKGQGFYFPKIPEINASDLNILLKDTTRVHNTSFTINDFEHDPRDYVNKAVTKYSGNTFIIHGGADGTEIKEIRIYNENNLNDSKILKDI